MTSLQKEVGHVIFGAESGVANVELGEWEKGIAGNSL